MKKQTIVILLPILLLVAYFLYRSTTVGTLETDLDNFVIEDISEVNKIIISDGKDTLILQKNDKKWKINSKYIARKEAVFNILKILNQLQIHSPVPNSQLDSINKTFTTDFVNVAVFENNSQLKSFKISKTKNKKGSFLLAKKTEKPLIMYILGMNKDLLTYFNPNTRFWRTKIIFDYNPNQIKAVEVIYPSEKEKSFKITTDDEIKFYNSENENITNFSLEKVKNYLSLFREIKYKRLVFEEELNKDSLQKREPKTILIITDKKNQKNTLKLYEKFNSEKQLNFDLLHGFQDNKTIFEITYFVLDPVLKEKDSF